MKTNIRNLAIAAALLGAMRGITGEGPPLSNSGKRSFSGKDAEKIKAAEEKRARKAAKRIRLLNKE